MDGFSNFKKVIGQNFESFPLKSPGSMLNPDPDPPKWPGSVSCKKTLHSGSKWPFQGHRMKFNEKRYFLAKNTMRTHTSYLFPYEYTILTLKLTYFDNFLYF